MLDDVTLRVRKRKASRGTLGKGGGEGNRKYVERKVGSGEFYWATVAG